jgi:hypothetical protein
MTEPIVLIEKVSPINVGLFSNGAAAVNVFKQPFIKPAPPIPATARPIINIVESFAVAQMSDPSSKIPRKTKNVYCEGGMSASLRKPGIHKVPSKIINYISSL